MLDIIYSSIFFFLFIFLYTVFFVLNINTQQIDYKRFIAHNSDENAAFLLCLMIFHKDIHWAPSRITSVYGPVQLFFF